MHPYLRIRPLTEEEYSQLRKMSTSRKLSSGRVKRAQIILLSNRGYLPTEIGQKLAIHERTARRWIGRYNRLGSSAWKKDPERDARGSTPHKR
jgi:transposase